MSEAGAPRIKKTPLLKPERDGACEDRRNGWRWSRLSHWEKLVQLVILASILLFFLQYGNQILNNKGMLFPATVVAAESSTVPESFRSLLSQRGSNNQIVVTVATISYAEITLNWICSLEKLQVENYIIGALDVPVLKLLTSKGYPVFPAFKSSVLGNQQLESEDNRIRTERFNKVNLVKYEVIVWAMKEGYEVVLSDTDVAWVHSPLHDLKTNYREYDFVFQNDEKYRFAVGLLNCGFFYAKPTEASITALEILTHALSKNSTLFDQDVVREILCLDSKRVSDLECSDPVTGAKSLMFPRYAYPTANLLKLVDDIPAMLKRPDLYIVHQTAQVPEVKKDRMIKNHIWYLDETKKCLI